MTKDRFSGPGRSPFDISPVLKWKNTSDESVPAYGIVKLTSYDAAGDFFNAVKPDGSGDLHFANGPVPVAVGAYGGSQLWSHSRIGKTSSATFGNTVGPIDDSWEMDESGSGFVLFSEPSAGIAAILQVGGGGSSAYSLTFSIVSHDPDTRTAIVHIESAWPAGPVPGSYLEDSVVNVCDMAGCYLNNPDTGALIGIWGHANYEIPRVPTVCDPNEYPPYAARWIVDAMCCPSTCVE